MIESVKDLTSFKWATVTSVAPLAVKLDGDTVALSLVPDSLVDPLTLSVSDRVRVELTERKVVIHGVNNAGALSGEVKMVAIATAPAGWLLCQGQSLLRASYPRLFAAIGTTYGAADSTHFTLPDLRGRVVVGRDSTQTEFDVLGEAGGAKTVTLTTSQIPSHSHQIGVQSGSDNNDFVAGSANAYGITVWASRQVAYDMLEPVGGGGSHNNLQPYLTLNYIIKL